MAQGRSIWGQVFKNFIKSIKPKKYWGVFKGKDHFGTEYFEIPKGEHHERRPTRWFVPAEKEKFNQEIPPEWEAWLRYRRKEPPTEEEIQRNLLQMHQTIQNAHQRNPPPKVEKPEVKDEEKPAFPVYEEYSTDFQKKG